VSNLSERIQKDLVAAMKTRHELELSVLRMLKSEIQKAQTEKGRTRGIESFLLSLRAARRTREKTPPVIKPR
jgi:uncharacterized protein YqeY